MYKNHVLATKEILSVNSIHGGYCATCRSRCPDVLKEQTDLVRRRHRLNERGLSHCARDHGEGRRAMEPAIQGYPWGDPRKKGDRDYRFPVRSFATNQALHVAAAVEASDDAAARPPHDKSTTAAVEFPVLRPDPPELPITLSCDWDEEKTKSGGDDRGASVGTVRQRDVS